MTDNTKTKRRKLSHQILALIGISGLLTAILFLLLVNIAATVAEVYCFEHDVPMTEFDWLDVDRWIFSVSALISLCFFSSLFLLLLRDRLAYIRNLTDGIDALRSGQQDHVIPLVGNNELTELAGAINEMSVAQQMLQQQEQALAQEKEQLIRTLSHDIRTPLTSILAYSDYLSSVYTISPEEQKSYMALIQRKALQIRDLTDILLDGGKRNLERFADGRLLMEQLAAEFEENLEDRFQIITDLTHCTAFAGTFDVQELRRIFDNLSSNIHKYADPKQPVILAICKENQSLIIRQTNSVLDRDVPAESYQLGISSIRRIAQHYKGQVDITRDAQNFGITITLSDFNR